jgi:hypothetical protein
VGLTTLPCKKKIVEKPPRNSAGFCGGGQGLSWAVEPRKKKKETFNVHQLRCVQISHPSSMQSLSPGGRSKNDTCAKRRSPPISYRR